MKDSRIKFSYTPSNEVVKSFRKTLSFSKNWNWKLITNNKVKKLISKTISRLLEEISEHLTDKDDYRVAFAQNLVDFEETFENLIFHDLKLKKNLKSNKFSLDLCRDFCLWTGSLDSCEFSSNFGDFELVSMRSWIVLKRI